MRVFKIEIDLSNDAFEEVGGAFELARILRKLSTSIEDGNGFEEKTLWDRNGNRVGKATWPKEEDLEECADCGASTKIGTPDPHVCGEGE